MCICVGVRVYMCRCECQRIHVQCSSQLNFAVKLVMYLEDS